MSKGRIFCVGVAVGAKRLDWAQALYKYLYNGGLEMTIVTYSYARQNLAKLMDEVERDHAPVFISRQRKRGAAVLVSEDEWSSIQETMYLLGNPENARRLRKGIAELNAGRGIEYDPAKPDVPPKPFKRDARARK